MKTNYPKTFVEPWQDYELIDAGGGKKLERFGKIYTIRPELQAYFTSERPFTEWRKQAHWEFVPQGTLGGSWKALRKDAPRDWFISYRGIRLQLEITKFKHIGVFPEQRVNWDVIADTTCETEGDFINLFAYTGAASLMARKVGMNTLHVDSVKQMLSWANRNMEASRLLNIKWVLEDALKFIQREERRGNSYDLIVMDPPAFGFGAKGEKWKIEDNIDALLGAAAAIRKESGKVIVNTYSPAFGIELFDELIQLYFPEIPYILDELWLRSSTGKEIYTGNRAVIG